MKEFYADKLKVKVFDTRAEMGRAAAADIRACMLELFEKRIF